MKNIIILTRLDRMRAETLKHKAQIHWIIKYGREFKEYEKIDTQTWQDFQKEIIPFVVPYKYDGKPATPQPYLPYSKPIILTKKEGRACDVKFTCHSKTAYFD